MKSFSIPVKNMNDPYLITQNSIDRLYNEYKKYGKIIVAVDFDDTVFDYHKKGYQYPALMQLLKDCQELDFYLVCFTGSPKEKYPEIEEQFKYWGIKISGINKNPFPMPFGNDGKIYYNILLDDRAGLLESFDILSRVVELAKPTKKRCEIHTFVTTDVCGCENFI